MGRLRTEHVYTCRGRQRAVFLRPECARVRFGVEMLPGDESRVEVSYDPVAQVRKGQGQWVVFEGGLAGGVEAATAVRLDIVRVDGWARMFVEQEIE